MARAITSVSEEGADILDRPPPLPPAPGGGTGTETALAPNNRFLTSSSSPGLSPSPLALICLATPTLPAPPMPSTNFQPSVCSASVGRYTWPTPPKAFYWTIDTLPDLAPSASHSSEPPLASLPWSICRRRGLARSASRCATCPPTCGTAAPFVCICRTQRPARGTLSGDARPARVS